jgi:hypothetical protein
MLRLLTHYGPIPSIQGRSHSTSSDLRVCTLIQQPLHTPHGPLTKLPLLILFSLPITASIKNFNAKPTPCSRLQHRSRHLYTLLRIIASIEGIRAKVMTPSPPTSQRPNLLLLQRSFRFIRIRYLQEIYLLVRYRLAKSS